MVGALAGAAVSGATNALIAHSNMSAQARENRITRSREDNAYQRAVADAQRAGLSPLAVVGTDGASAQSMTAPSMDSDIVSKGIGSFTALRQNQSQLDLNNAQIANINSETVSRNIENSFKASEHLLGLSKMYEEIAHMQITNQRDKIYRDNLLRLLNSQIANFNSQAGLNNAKASEQVRATASAKLSSKYNLLHGLPSDTTHSLSHAGIFGSGASLYNLAGLVDQDLGEYDPADLGNAVGDLSNTPNAKARAAEFEEKKQLYEKAVEDYKDYRERVYNMYYFKFLDSSYYSGNDGAKRAHERATELCDKYFDMHKITAPSPKDFGLPEDFDK